MTRMEHHEDITLTQYVCVCAACVQMGQGDWAGVHVSGRE